MKAWSWMVAATTALSVAAVQTARIIGGRHWKMTLRVRVRLFAMAGAFIGSVLAVIALPTDEGTMTSVFRVFSAAVVFGIIGRSLAAYTSPHGVTERYKKKLRRDVTWYGLWFMLVGFPVLMAFGAVPMTISLIVMTLVVGLCARAKERQRMSTPEC